MRLREVLALLVGVGVVLGLGYLGYGWFLAATEPDATEAQEVAAGAGEVVEDYLAAWNRGDLTAMQGLVTDEPPEDFARRHEQLSEALAPTRFEVTAGELTELTEGRAQVPLTLTVAPAQAPGPVSWESALVLSRRAGEWSVDWSLSTIHPELRPTWGFAVSTEEVSRRPILAADGTALASDDGRWLGFVPAGIEDPDRIVAAFERALPGTGAAAERELSGELVEDWFYPVAVVGSARADAAWTRLRRTPGIVEPRRPPVDERRALLDLGFAQHLVGVVAEASAEQLEELAEEGSDAPVGTQVPQYGLEEAFDEQLTGSEVVRVGLAELTGGELTEVIAEVQAEPSAAVETTLDVAVQRAIENALVEVELPAAIVAVDGSDGAVLGTASRPLSGFDRARAGRYPPGSVFKLITLEAALAAGYDLDDEVSCPGRTVVGGLEVPNADGFDLGTVTLEEALAASCNTTFAELAAELGTEALEEAAARFGFGTDPQHPLGAFGGSFPTPQDTAELAAAGFGQGRVEASALHLASVAAAVLEGVWHQPYVLATDGPGDSEALATGAAERLRTAMRRVVTDGTGTPAAVDGVELLGKTGTAQAGDGVTHAWFVGAVDGLGFAVFVEDGGSGGEVAGPLAARFVSELERLRDGEVDPADPASAAWSAAPPEPEDEAGADTSSSEGSGGEGDGTQEEGPVVRPEDG
ncbi:MAG: penicillin-binding transpeptidase domain-containing protein [Nitriliruptoraceae bacterium]